MGALGNCVGRRRAAAGLRQQDLAARAGVSRQSLSALEAGHSVPSAALALRLARELGCRVEDLFWTDDRHAPIHAELASDDIARPRALPRRRPPGDARVGLASRVVLASRAVLASINGRWVAHRLTADDPGALTTPADGALSGRAARGGRGARVTPFADLEGARETLLCAGCAPAGGILAARATAARTGDRVVWLDRSSGAALDLLARGQVHVAGAHLYDEDAHEFNVPFVRRRLPGRSMLIFNLARWQAGLVVAPGNPRRIRGVRDLARADVRFVSRPPGAAAQDLIERLLRCEGLSAAAPVPIVGRGHMDVARLVALGLGDAAVALPEAARAHGLAFIPLAEERFDLILAKEHANDARIVRLLDLLSARGFRREMETLGGHVTRDAGRLIADTSALSTDMNDPGSPT
jgi:molybdate-binding protein/DNA-binding XRE family transcriptional regulator